MPSLEEVVEYHPLKSGGGERGGGGEEEAISLFLPAWPGHIGRFFSLSSADD